jgi:hypothetical protein
VITRRTFLATGASVAAVGAAVAAVGVRVAERPLPLTLATMRGMVGETFQDRETGARLRLDAVTGSGGKSARDDAFTLSFRTPETRDLPGAIRTLVQGDRSLTLHLGPVGREGDTLEAVVNRTA